MATGLFLFSYQVRPLSGCPLLFSSCSLSPPLSFTPHALLAGATDRIATNHSTSLNHEEHTRSATHGRRQEKQNRCHFGSRRRLENGFIYQIFSPPKYFPPLKIWGVQGGENIWLDTVLGPLFRSQLEQRFHESGLLP